MRQTSKVFTTQILLQFLQRKPTEFFKILHRTWCQSTISFRSSNWNSGTYMAHRWCLLENLFKEISLPKYLTTEINQNSSSYQSGAITNVNPKPWTYVPMKSIDGRHTANHHLQGIRNPDPRLLPHYWKSKFIPREKHEDRMEHVLFVETHLVPVIVYLAGSLLDKQWAAPRGWWIGHIVHLQSTVLNAVECGVDAFGTMEIQQRFRGRGRCRSPLYPQPARNALSCPAASHPHPPLGTIWFPQPVTKCFSLLRRSLPVTELLIPSMPVRKSAHALPAFKLLIVLPILPNT